MKVRLATILLLLSAHPIFTKISVDDLKYRFSGFVEYEAFFDTRQTVGFSLTESLLFPAKKDPDPLGKDRNAKGQSSMAAFSTKVNLTVDGIKINKADAQAVIEADFLGLSDIPNFRRLRSDVPNILRLRLAYAQFDWDTTSLLVGQTWHPIGPKDVLVTSISSNTGNPLEVYARSPQITFTYHTPTIQLLASALTQIEFLSDGPNGLSPEYIRNAVVPNLHGQVRWLFSGHMAGAGIDYKRLVPRIKTNKNFKVRESLNSVAAIVYLVLEYPRVQSHTKFIIGQNISDYGAIGGYAVKKDSIDPITDKRQYANLRTVSLWNGTCIKNLEKYEPGIFIGVTKNLGSSKKIEPNLIDAQGNVIERRIFGTGNDVNIIFRIAPHLQVRYGPVTIAGEVEYTRATFGLIEEKGKVSNTTPVANTRLLFAAFYYF